MKRNTDEKPKCWGCECEVERDRYGYHREPTDVPGQVYVYPCTAVQQSEWSNAT